MHSSTQSATTRPRARHDATVRQLALAQRYRALARQRWLLVLRQPGCHFALRRLLGDQPDALSEAIAKWQKATGRGQLTTKSVELQSLATRLLSNGSAASWIASVEDDVVASLARWPQPGSANNLRAEIEQLRADQLRVRERLVLCSVDLVEAMARRFTRTRSRLPDATQEGYLGLLRAIDLFDPNIGIQFSTYATWWIRRAVARDMLASHTIRVPESVLLAARRHRRSAELASKVEGRALSVAEIARDSGDSEETVRQARQWGKPNVRSLDQPSDPGDVPLLAQRIADDASQALFEKSEQRHTINALLDKLTLQEANIIRAHYGLEDGEEKRFACIGERLNVSRETVRQIERRALLKLRQLTLG